MRNCTAFLLASVLALTPLASLPVGADTSITAHAQESSRSNPNASAEAQSLYRFLNDTYGNFVISGQQESTWMGSEDYEFEIIQNASGRLLAG